MPRPHATRRFHFLMALLVFLLDQGTKWLIRARIPLHESIPVIPGFFRLTHVQNRGAAFGLFSDSPSEWRVGLLILFSVAALIVVSRMLWKNSHFLSATGFALALILGGAIGNLWDRLSEGLVVDYLDFNLGSYHWPAFNVADSAIVVGALILIAEILFSRSAAEDKAVPRQP
ncbi:MAG: signal peptidase II [Acidobacteria bacterium]|nr:signal peptidase II [Acidobacteriota bacterium]